MPGKLSTIENFSANIASVMLNDDGEALNLNALRTNLLLRTDEWKLLDTAILEEHRIRLNAVADLMQRGLTYNIPDGLGVMLLEWHTQSTKSGARMDMSPQTQELSDRVKFELNQLPLPVIHDDYQLGIRDLKAGRRKGQPLDTINASEASKNIAEYLEGLLINGTGSYTWGGGTIYGYTNFPDRNTTTLSTNWDDSSKTGANILADVVGMKQALINDRFFGPYVIYIPTAYETVLDEDYSSNYGGETIRSRIMKLKGIEDIKVCDTLSANNVVMVQMTSDVVRMVNGLPLQNVQWDTKGGMLINFKVMTIQVPQLRSTQANRCGICHLS